MTEVELKLELGNAALEALEWSGLLPGSPAVAQQTSTYFDTPGFDLAQAGISLRVRQCGVRRIQTVKAGGGGATGLLTRSEWEREIDRETPVFDETTEAVQALLGTRTASVVPAFEATVERRTWVVVHEGATIEVVADQGKVSRGDREAAILEMELELKAGPAPALFGFARKVAAVTPVRLGVLAKAERGFQLTRPQRAMFKAEPVALAGTMTAAEAFRHVAHGCIRQFRLNEDLILASPGPEPLHQARVALRRLRSAFSIFRPILTGDPVAARLREELRSLASELGAARDLDVLLGNVGSGALHDRLQPVRRDAYERVAAALASPRSRMLMFDLSEWLNFGGWQSGCALQGRRNEPAAAFATAALRRLRRRVKRAGRKLGSADDESRHELRKAAKKLRYATEFFTRLYPDERARRRHRKFLAALADLQDQLGLLNDLATASEMLPRLGMADHPDARALLGHEKQGMIAAAAKAHASLIKAKRFWPTKSRRDIPAHAS